MSVVHQEDHLVEQPALELCAELGCATACGLEETIAPDGGAPGVAMAARWYSCRRAGWRQRAEVLIKRVQSLQAGEALAIRLGDPGQILRFGRGLRIVMDLDPSGCWMSCSFQSG